MTTISQTPVGKTPLVALDRMFPPVAVPVFAKLEMLNVGGSVKDRTAHYMVDQAIAAGRITTGSHLVESSSGNLAIALAMIARQRGLAFTAVVDPNIAAANLRLIEAYGGRIDMVEEKDEEGGYLHTRVRRVQHLAAKIPGAVWLNQYANPDNWRAHYNGIGAEIVREMPVEPTHVVAAVSTCGTLMGLARRLRERWPRIEVVAVDMEGSVIFGAPGGRRDIPGIGASRVPEQLEESEVDAVIYATDWEAALGCRRLVDTQGILAGGSSGAVIAAITKLVPELPRGSRIVTLLPDRGERYLDTVHDRSWPDEERRLTRSFADSHHRVGCGRHDAARSAAA
ncbi:2,3-diaminopropionate biosynthesis protein SbnA [Methylobacterium haplocladii]|uniref:Putative siderophore biosynthesis protein SbnA n=1 Tax=Methylobacterium haplocladii TaxID=1176176 RepID=A0A512INM7_9HYPH|nr:2,3-diaminopropionate biosynthesis protein SbnA [Methylobacterium haplocladii]GEO99319.1 putative siderophore biosynthesis protein SbnA [Methylobacterium haplocladii]GJD83480.1 N-(2-amino-2-carboxyethyl)-L-glutamate synthase [Methylobacterium haplocladii]GLS61207.1 2,3-diaminopropionate biosynthesis protein SbnA [Methylobacterium haplocladii]